jgi:hypothetical protein
MNIATRKNYCLQVFDVLVINQPQDEKVIKRLQSRQSIKTDATGRCISKLKTAGSARNGSRNQGLVLSWQLRVGHGQLEQSWKDLGCLFGTTVS